MKYDSLVSEKAKQIPPSGIRKFFDIVNEMKDAISFTIDSCRKIMKNLDLENNCQVRQKGEKSEAYNTWNRKCNRHGVL